MKLKLAYYVMSRARHFLRPAARQYELAAALVRHRALRAARRCSAIGRNTDVQLHKSLKEFLAFFCVVALNELALQEEQHLDAELKESYQKLIKALCEGPEPDAALVPHQLTVARIITYKKSGFDHWFFGYWNADFAGMRITERDFADLRAKRIELPEGSTSADAGLILLIRLARLDSGREILPSAEAIRRYDQAIREEVTDFTKALMTILP